MDKTEGHTSQPYRGYTLRVLVYRPASQQDPNWGYEVVVLDDEGSLMSGPHFPLSGYITRGAAEDASSRRGRLAVDVLLGEL
ncbi:hypothetical protein [Cupriavidus plantarum]|uniref:Uncharacterized protein n=1 Tax=Cupriavidus plantarum TaxID=942865 RepID=A0A316EP67_9BURK|nr:hypothetical protein [Cupriavidus plantarum]NYI01955.1 hypothetical protein [Cupriavidus plantarum]PWK34088.1 hypothetical protein C7419_103407 [Cupriavidus plantarum]REE91261.1 hypothetical protein C7418_4564 [Cupriavidus plantarum]RLK31615.1 hypothetical protein C7417_4592 [Cupriavidus plantarum]CAG2147042.1 hypothetical protein LMG26296_04016 [Cupriavidus plantarum]